MEELRDTQKVHVAVIGGIRNIHTLNKILKSISKEYPPGTVFAGHSAMSVDKVNKLLICERVMHIGRIR